MNRTIEEGTRSLLLQSGLHHSWWPEAARCFAIVPNAAVTYKDGGVPYTEHFQTPFPGMLLPCGVELQYKPSMPKGDQRDPVLKFAVRTKPGIFVGYYLGPGGKWTGD